MNREQIEQQLLGHVQEKYMTRMPQAASLTTETHLFQEGIVDSIGVLMLVQYLENEFEMSVDPEEMVLDNFASISHMARLVSRKSGVTG